MSSTLLRSCRFIYLERAAIAQRVIRTDMSVFCIFRHNTAVLRGVIGPPFRVSPFALIQGLSCTHTLLLLLHTGLCVCNVPHLFVLYIHDGRCEAFKVSAPRTFRKPSVVLRPSSFVFRLSAFCVDYYCLATLNFCPRMGRVGTAATGCCSTPGVSPLPHQQ